MSNGQLILIADDDEDIVRFIEVNLRLEGFDVAISSDGSEVAATMFDGAEIAGIGDAP